MTDDEAISLGINTRADLAGSRPSPAGNPAPPHARGRDGHGPGLDGDRRRRPIGEDTTIEPFCFLRGQVEIGAGCTVGPMTSLTDCVLADDVT